MNTKKILLLMIITLALVLRLYRLGDYPALNADEAALGYNAYSILETGRDEHGNSWPLHFQSFNDYKPGLYVYLVMPFVALFGLDVFWVRFPGALLGVATVLLLYFLVKEILLSEKDDKGGNGKWKIGLIAAFLLAINPWHIHFSRGAWEVNVATFLMTAGVYLFLRWTNPLQHTIQNGESKKNSSHSLRGVRGDYQLYLSIILFVLSLYTYHSARIISPLLGLGLLLIFVDKIGKHFKQFTIAIIIGLILSVPLIISMINGNIFSRASGVGLLADIGPINRVNEQRGEHRDLGSLSSQILHNKLINYSLKFADNWSQHYHGEFLFLSGDDIQRNKVPETGQMYLFDMFLIPLGFAFIIKKKWRGGILVLWWLLVAPIAAALTFQSPHALRAQNMVIPLVILSAFGIYYFLEIIKKTQKLQVFPTYTFGMSLMILLILWNFTRYQHLYWVHMSKEYPFSSQYGVEQLVDYLEENKKQGQKIVVTDRYDQPYILFLFYTKYPPELFQKDHNLTSPDNFGFSTVRGFGDYRFESIDYDTIRVQYPNSIIAGTDEEIPDWSNITQEIVGTNGYKYFEVVQN